jgi:hypothetical protein
MECCQDATASPFVTEAWSRIFAHFHAVAVNITVVCGMNRPARTNSLIDVKEDDEHALDFALYLSHLFVSTLN